MRPPSRHLVGARVLSTSQGFSVFASNNGSNGKVTGTVAATTTSTLTLAGHILTSQTLVESAVAAVASESAHTSACRMPSTVSVGVRRVRCGSLAVLSGWRGLFRRVNAQRRAAGGRRGRRAHSLGLTVCWESQVARVPGFEPGAYRLGGGCSIQLSYTRVS